ncbi:MAG: hypothetical protein HQ537_01625 [Parcubacteria group bacterium]|nr:hypothetical protein [Parcubacteria group bacterium]
MLSIKELLKKIGLWAVFILITYILTTSFRFILNYFKLNKDVAIGIPGILVFYFWGGYFLRKHGWSKTLGIVLFIVAIALNFVFISSPYDTASEFKATRVFSLFPLLAGIFLILRKGKISRLMGTLVIILTILSALLGLVFCSSCWTPQTKIETYSVSIPDPKTKIIERYKCSSPNYDNDQAEALAPSASLLQKLNDEAVSLNNMATQLNEMGSQSSTNNYDAVADDYNTQKVTYEADKKQYDSEEQVYENYIKTHCAYVGN